MKTAVAALSLCVLALPPSAPARSMDAPYRGVDVPCSRFAFRMLEALREKAPEGNLAFSPLNVSTVLAMTLNGCSGAAREAMLRALSAEGLSEEDLNRGYAALLESFREPGKGVSLSLAQTLWVQKGLPLEPGFLDRCRQGFGAEPSQLDFSDPKAPDVIDAWVSKQTRGRIPSIASRPMPPDLALVLAGAVHFKGDWAVPFDKALTKQAFFYGAGPRNKPPGVWMMERTDEFAHVRGEGFQAAALPYGDGRFEMIVLLPDEGKTLADLGNAISMEGWTGWRPRMAFRKGTVQLPRFKIEWGDSLKEALSSLGMGRTFAPGEEFRRMGPGELYIGEVRHKAFVAVDETGTEAAAATAVEMCFGCAKPPQEEKPFVLRCDRPFFFAIRDTRTGIPLFLGVLNDPA